MVNDFQFAEEPLFSLTTVWEVVRAMVTRCITGKMRGQECTISGFMESRVNGLDGVLSFLVGAGNEGRPVCPLGHPFGPVKLS